MDLLKQISEEIKAYHAFVFSLVEKIEGFEEAISLEKRLGIYESPYYQNGNQQQPKNDTVDFQPQGDVAKPQQISAPKGPAATNTMSGRIQLMYNPATGRVEDAKQASGMNTAPANGYVQANAQQLADALKHIEGIDKALADKIVAGNVQVFVPQNPEAPKASPDVKQHGGMNRMEMDPSQLAAAHAAADKMSLA